LDGLLDRRPRQLSGGQQQRVALARAIIRQPVAFLMDEPLSNLDANLRLQMRAELKGLQRELGTTMLYVTHDHAEAMTLAHRIAVLRDGTLQQVGTPMELYRRPGNRFVAGFLGTPPMNFLSGSVQEGAFRFEGGSIPLSEKQVAASAGVEKLMLGFRPQEALLSPAGQAGAFEGSVYVTEEMGSETFVVLSCEKDWITVEAGLGVRPAPGDKLAVAVPVAAVHLFEAASGRTLISGSGG
jgi:multiple sugar transport system ATP-binding protein